MTTDSETQFGDDLDQPPPVEGFSISGQVTDFDDVPLVGVRVEAAVSGGADLDLLPVLTDGEGHFAVEGLATGRYDLRFVLGRVKARTLAVPTGTDQLQVRLARPQGILLVTKTESGSEPPPIVNFVLHRVGPEGRMIREHFGRTLKRRLLLWSIRPGAYTLTAWGGRFLPVVVTDVDVVENLPAPEVEIVFGPEGGTVRGSVVDGAGAPVEASVSWRRVDAPGHAPRHLTTQGTTSEGTFVTRGLPQGRYRFSAWDGDTRLADAEIDVSDEAEHELQLAF